MRVGALNKPKGLLAMHRLTQRYDHLAIESIVYSRVNNRLSDGTGTNLKMALKAYAGIPREYQRR